MNATVPGAVRVGHARCSTDEQDVIERGFSGTTRRNRGGLDQALAAV